MGNRNAIKARQRKDSIPHMGWQRGKFMMRFNMFICAFVCMAVSASVASGYRFIVSGVPVQDVSYPTCREIAEIETGGKSVSAVNPEECDARCRTISISESGNLLTTKRIGFHMILR